MEKTSIKLRNKLLYQVFVRNHTPEGTFRALIGDLDRIQALGTDIVYLLPIHPIGEKNRKGSIGSPYSIRDYRQINPDLGTKEDFQALIEAVHERKMKLMIDVVYNHTSRDSYLLKTHPEWFYKNENGVFANRVGDWWDVTDFDFRGDKALWVELADTLKSYAEMGVDGFRCDVASLVPIAFWKYARKVVANVNKNVIWLSESVHGGFVKYIRDLGFAAASEAEIYQAFDMAYDYDIQPYFEGYLKGQRPLKDYLEGIIRQEEIYPANYVKVKNLENHDLERIARFVHDDIEKVFNWTAFVFLQKGAAMIYAGQEFLANKRPDLFEKDVFDRTKGDISAFIATLATIKKRSVFADGLWKIMIPALDGVACTSVENQKEKWIGVFNLGLVEGKLPLDLPDGRYVNRLTGKSVRVTEGKLSLTHQPVLIKITK